MSWRRQLSLAFVGVLLVTGLSACGGSGGGSAGGAQQGNGDAASQLAAMIKSRLNAAGYKPTAPSQLIGSATNPPIPEQAFRFEVDPKSPESFTVTVLVFHTAKDAALFLQHNAAACAKIASCVKAQKDNYGQGRQRHLGAVIYGGTSDSGTSVVPLAEFDKLVALAQGTAG